MTTLRPYQSVAVDAVLSSSARRVCVVAPTGAGKTRMGREIIDRLPGPALWVVHTLDLVAQARSVLPSHVTVKTIQALIRQAPPEAALVVLDECHHYAADEWAGLPTAYPTARIVGLTATPQRGDGRPLAGLFDDLIVAAQYPDLVENGYLVPARIIAPDEALDRGLAQHPLDAYISHGEGRSGMLYARTIEQAYDYASKFRDRGIPAETIEADTLPEERAAILDRLRDGTTKIVTNVYCLTEGVDIPSASICILARGVGAASTYLQMCGRVLRPAPGKTDALILDLPGVSYIHGTPTDEREYTLDGDGISSPRAQPVTTCPACGATFASGPDACPMCGYTSQTEIAPYRIYDAALAEVYNGALTADSAKRNEFQRLLSVARERDFSIGWCVREYTKLFGHRPIMSAITMADKTKEYRRLAAFARQKGYRDGWIAHRYRDVFGVWPRGFER